MCASIAVVQARTNSSRLPAKALMPLAGLPLAILCIKRAANRKQRVLLATSDQESDDLLAQMAQEHGVDCYRGSLTNPLQRIVNALEGFSDDTLVFRLTADNPFPDGMLLEQMERHYQEQELDYLCCGGEQSGLPYGVSAELMRLSHLREALVKGATADDFEHVTPYIRREYGEVFFDLYKENQMGHFRATIDNFDDYISAQKTFGRATDPINTPFTELVELLRSVPSQPESSLPSRKLVLGTAQLGIPYGIANVTGKPDVFVAVNLVKKAIANGVSYIDTARSYGDSEEVIGEVSRQGWGGRASIVTKLSPLDLCPDNASKDVVSAFVDASIQASRAALGVQHLDVVLLHRASQIHQWDGAVWSRLRELKSEGLIRRLGVSVQTPQELEMCLKISDVEYLQMPYNILDWRWESCIPLIEHTRSDRGLTVHLRSALLQGLLTSEKQELWSMAGVSNLAQILSWLEEILQESGLGDIASLCLLFCESQNWADGVVVGMESADQLTQNLKTFGLPALSKDFLTYVGDSRPRVGERTLNPANWGSQ